jgi:hypothetical protein
MAHPKFRRLWAELDLLLAKEVVTAVIFSILFGKHTLSIL